MFSNLFSQNFACHCSVDLSGKRVTPSPEAMEASGIMDVK